MISEIIRWTAFASGFFAIGSLLLIIILLQKKKETAKAKLFLRFGFLHRLHKLGVLMLLVGVCATIIFFNLADISELWIPYGVVALCCYLTLTFMGFSIYRMLKDVR
jgi:hypothetical protein